MNMVNLRRGAKYFAAFVVLFAVVVAVLCATGLSAVPAGEMGYALLHTRRGAMMLILAVGIAVTYPISGFVRREAAADIDTDRKRIVDSFASAGFVLTGEADGEMTFRAASPLRRARLLWEDEITVAAKGRGTITVEGIRRVAVPVALRIESAAREKI